LLSGEHVLSFFNLAQEPQAISAIELLRQPKIRNAHVTVLVDREI